MNLYILIGYFKKSGRREFWWHMPAETPEKAVEYWRDAEPSHDEYRDVTVWLDEGGVTAVAYLPQALKEKGAKGL